MVSFSLSWGVVRVYIYKLGIFSIMRNDRKKIYICIRERVWSVSYRFVQTHDACQKYATSLGVRADACGVLALVSHAHACR